MSDPQINLNIEVTNDTRKSTPRHEPRDWYPSSQAQELVRKFHAAFDQPIANHPQTIGEVRGLLCVGLIENALKEFEKAIHDDDLVNQYDALLEILLQTYGTLVEMGVDAGPGKREVMRSKMTMQNEVFEEPNLFNVLTKQGWRPSYEDYLKYNNLKDPREVLQALAGRPTTIEQVIEFVPTENPQGDDVVKTKKVHLDNRATRKDNFSDRVLYGWTPTREQQLAYEAHRQELEKKYPESRVEDNQIVMINYLNGEKDVDWDFQNNVPRVVEG